MKAPIRHLAWICVLLCGDLRGQSATYTVKPGDSLSKIARGQGCTVEALAKANGIKLSEIIQAGQTLKLPVKAGMTTSGGSHIIEPGDTFSSISRQHGVSVESLLAANPGLNPKSLKPGQKIMLSAAAKPLDTKAETPAEPARTSPRAAPEEPAVDNVEQLPDATPATPKADPSPQPAEEKVQTIVVDSEITFGEFATRHSTDIQRLNELNGLDLTGATVLAKGSELYVPVQAQGE